MLPNVAHCGGGSGPSKIGGGTGDPLPAFRDADHDVVLALARWVEQGIAPEAIIATTLKDGAVVRQRPVCVYPKQARYNGAGDINVAANFSCVSPGAAAGCLDGRSQSDPELAAPARAARARALKGPFLPFVSGLAHRTRGEPTPMPALRSADCVTTRCK